MSTTHPFEISDEDFWSNPDKNLSKLAGTRVRSDISGIISDSPKKIPLDQRQEWPYLVLQTGDTEELYKVRFADHAIITAFCPVEAVLYAAKAVSRMGPRVPPGPFPSPGFTSTFKNINARAALGIPWRNGRYILTTLIRDQTSNRVSVDLVSSLANYEDQEVQKFLAAQERQQPPRLVSPPLGDIRVSYEKTDKSPLLPLDPALTLSIDRVIEALPEAKALLRGSYFLPVRTSDVIAQDAARSSPQKVSAVVPISLLVVGSDDAIPEILRLVVPSFKPIINRSGSQFAAGYFSIDMAQMGSFMQRPQTYFIYAFAGEVMTPATLMAVVPRQAK